MRAWEEFITNQEKELGQETVAKWLRPLKVVRFDACNLYLEAPDSFKIVWFEEHVRYRIQQGLYNNNHKPIKVHIALASDKEPLVARKRKGWGATGPGAPPFSLKFDELDGRATFANFFTSESNVLAYKLLQEAAALILEGPSAVLPFNPIYLFGKTGTGKTHLLMALAHHLNLAGKRAIYVRADTFTEHVVNAIRTGEMQMFRRAYRNVDALLIDDVAVFSRKTATQEELFHTFNTLHIEGKQIVLAGQCPPQELKSIEPRLISRFEWGIVVPLQTLSREKMEQLLITRSAALQFPLDEEVKGFLVDTFGGHTKSLMRALEAVVLRIHLNHGQRQVAPSVATVKQYLADLIQEEEHRELTPSQVIRTVAEYYGIPLEDLLSKSQARECVLPRQVAMHLCRDKLHLSFPKIGDLFARDHSTVMVSVKHIQQALDTKNREIIHSIKGILSRLEQVT